MISFKTLRSLCLDFIIFFIPIALLWMALPKIIAVLLPFLLGYLLYLIANPLNRRLKTRLPDSISAFLSLFFISVGLGLALWLLFSNLVRELVTFSVSSSLYEDAIPFISRQINAFASYGAGLFDSFRNEISDILYSTSVWILNFAKNIPSLLITAFTTVFTAFFLLKDTSTIYSGARTFFGEKLCLKFTEIKKAFLDVVSTYLKAQLIIESIIFAVLFLGFSFLGVRYSLLLAFFTAIVDVFPILGTGAVLVPGAIFYFVARNPVTGWGFLVLYGVSIFARQMCEPKIVGSKLGIHPLTTIIAIYAGMKLFGFWGLILGPIVSIFVKNLFFAKKD